MFRQLFDWKGRDDMQPMTGMDIWKSMQPFNNDTEVFNPEHEHPTEWDNLMDDLMLSMQRR